MANEALTGCLQLVPPPPPPVANARNGPLVPLVRIEARAG